MTFCEGELSENDHALNRMRLGIAQINLALHSAFTIFVSD